MMIVLDAQPTMGMEVESVEYEVKFHVRAVTAYFLLNVYACAHSVNQQYSLS